MTKRITCAGKGENRGLGSRVLRAEHRITLVSEEVTLRWPYGVGYEDHDVEELHCLIG
jgi:hypothetical protein